MISKNRRKLLLNTPLLFCLPKLVFAKETVRADHVTHQLKQLERSFNGRIGVYLKDLHQHFDYSYRGEERFAMCSTFKMILIGAILKKAEQHPPLLSQKIHYQASDLPPHSPITEQHLKNGLTVAKLCAAALQYSDNGAANLLLKLIGGPQTLTRIARTMGDLKFNLTRWETELNDAIPGDTRDTSTPKAMANTLEKLAFGHFLSPKYKAQLIDWMKGNTTGGKRIKAGLPKNWQIADKTGSGDYGTTNDIGILFPPHRSPLILSIYTTQTQKNAPWRDDVIATITQSVLQLF